MAKAFNFFSWITKSVQLIKYLSEFSDLRLILDTTRDHFKNLGFLS